jgi:SAM-dependent methyltransferase
MTACFEPRRFRSTVPYYARYRVPYPAPLISFVHERCGLRAGSRVLDLGCGPGQLAVAFATFGCAVTAMDPEPEMLAAMKQRATAADASIEAVRASSHDLDGSFGHFDLVAMGRSFHWMERDETLNRLNEIVAPTGAVVLLGDRRISTPGVDWPAVVERLAEVFAPARTAERRERRRSACESHEEVLLRSPFRHLERYGIVFSQTLNAYDVVGRSFSMSATSPEALGSRQKDFESELHAELVRLSPDAIFHEVVEANALIATREVRKSPTEESRRHRNKQRPLRSVRE